MLVPSIQCEYRQDGKFGRGYQGFCVTNESTYEKRICAVEEYEKKTKADINGKLRRK